MREWLLGWEAARHARALELIESGWAEFWWYLWLILIAGFLVWLLAEWLENMLG